LIFPEQHPDRLRLPSLEVPGLLSHYTSKPDHHFWLAEGLSLKRCGIQTPEQHFSSIPRSGQRLIVANKAAYKRACLYQLSGKKACEFLRKCKGKAKLYALILSVRKTVGCRLGQTERRLNFTLDGSLSLFAMAVYVLMKAF
jgi:hypothetical protein